MRQHPPVKHVAARVLSLLKGVHPSPGECRRHASHDAPEAQGGPLGAGLGAPHPAHQPVKRREDAVVVLRRRHLVEVAAGLEGQPPALLAGHGPPVVQVPLVAHDDDGGLVCAQAVSGRPDGLDEPADGVETGSVADAVDEDEPVGPLHLLRKERRLQAQILSEQMRDEENQTCRERASTRFTGLSIRRQRPVPACACYLRMRRVPDVERHFSAVHHQTVAVNRFCGMQTESYDLQASQVCSCTLILDTHGYPRTLR